MIYLKNDNSSQVLSIPRSRSGVVGRLRFKAFSTIDRKEFIDMAVIDARTSELYYRMSVILPADLPIGEYEYSLSDDEGALSQGLLMIGDFSSPTEYNNVIEYEQYE